MRKVGTNNKLVNVALAVMVILSAVFLMANSANAASFEETLTKAKSGDARAQVDVGIIYRDGKGTKKNIEEGFKWIKKSAEQKDPKGINALGRAYFDGVGVPRSMKSLTTLGDFY